MKIELGKTSTQKRPVSEDSYEEEMRTLYKQEIGVSALYKRNGEWHESKKYKEWKNKQLAKLHEEVQKEEIDPKLQQISSEDLDQKNLIKMFGMGDQMKKYNEQLGKTKKEAVDRYVDVNICMECGERKMINPGSACCEKCDDKMEGKKHVGKVQKTIKKYQIGMQYHCLFLYSLMSNKMEFTESPTTEEIDHITEIKKALDHWLDIEEEK